MNLKRCTRCHQVKPATTEHFYAQKAGKNGLMASCIICERQRMADNKVRRLKVDEIEYRQKRLIAVRKWREKHPERSRLVRRKADANAYEKRKNDPTQHFSRAVSNLLRGHLRKRLIPKNNRTEKILGYSIHELKLYIEKLFLDGMSWDNYGQWHIDHIRPVSSFNFTSENDPEFKACWAMSNLQPLWAKDNISKNGRLNWDGRNANPLSGG